MELQLLKPLDKVGEKYPLRFTNETCDALVAIPIGGTLVWEMLMCTNELGFFDFDLLSISAFPKRIMEGSNTAISAIDISVSSHGIKKVVIFQSSDYHNNGASERFMKKIDEDAYHKKCLIACYKYLKDRHPGLEIILVYARIIDASHLKFSLIEESGVEQLIMSIKCDCFARCDAVVITCMDFRFWREYLSYLWHVLGVRKPTIISMPGSAKKIIAGKKTALKAVDLAMSIYAKELADCAVCQHRGCAAYAEELKIFGGDSEGEQIFQLGQLEAASDIIQQRSGNPVIKIYADCDGQTIEHALV